MVFLRRGAALGLLLASVALGVATGCAGHSLRPDPSRVPRTLGPTPAFRPAILGRPTRCERTRGVRYGVHLELFALGHVVLIPAGVGISPPLQTRGPYVLGGSCYAAAITREPTGVLEITSSGRGAVPTLGDLFALWGQPLAARRLANFAHRPVTAYIDGRAAIGPAAAIPLTRHAEIVLEIGGHVPPHHSYGFANGL